MAGFGFRVTYLVRVEFMIKVWQLQWKSSYKNKGGKKEKLVIISSGYFTLLIILIISLFISLVMKLVRAIVKS
jgi:hypothetical protein